MSIKPITLIIYKILGFVLALFLIGALITLISWLGNATVNQLFT